MSNEIPSIAVKATMKMIGIHLPNNSFMTGQDDVEAISLGDPGTGDGNMLVRIDFTSDSGKEPRVFLTMPTCIAREYVQTSDLVVPDTELIKSVNAA